MLELCVCVCVCVFYAYTHTHKILACHYYDYKHTYAHMLACVCRMVLAKGCKQNVS